jgi:phosphinothricin acetyltransferase
MPDIIIRPLCNEDGAAVLAIYDQGIATGHATFQASVPSWEDWCRGHLDEPRLVAEEEGWILGWAALSPVSGRCVYGGVAEVSLYVAAEARGRGIGARLMAALVAAAEAAEIWTLQAGIFPENVASLELHKRHGFRVVGTRERLGRMTHGPLAGAWRDVVLMERRSAVVGED